MNSVSDKLKAYEVIVCRYETNYKVLEKYIFISDKMPARDALADPKVDIVEIVETRYKVILCQNGFSRQGQYTNRQIGKSQKTKARKKS